MIIYGINPLFEAMRAGGNAPVTLNAANEIAVESFLEGDLRFDRIPRLIAEVLERVENSPVDSLDDVLEHDRRARNLALEFVAKL